MKIDPDNSGIRIRFEATVQQSADQTTQVTLQWAVAIQDCQSLMKLEEGDMLYVYANANKTLKTWTVSSYVKIVGEKTSSAEAFVNRAKATAELFSEAAPDIEATPQKRKADLLQIVKRNDNIGVYA